MLFVKKRCFTLLEIMIVAFLISLGAAVTGIKMKEAYDEQRFLSETGQVISYLTMAQDLMLIMDADVTVNFIKKEKSLQLKIDVEKPLQGPLARLIERKINLKTITNVKFNGKEDKKLALQFSFGNMSKGPLSLQGKEKNKTIELLGYPCPLGNRKAAKKMKKGREDLYPQKVYEVLYEKNA